MFTYQILIEYDGTNFVGWQRQKNDISIQGSIEKVLKKLLKQKVILHRVRSLLSSSSFDDT